MTTTEPAPWEIRVTLDGRVPTYVRELQGIFRRTGRDAEVEDYGTFVRILCPDQDSARGTLEWTLSFWTVTEITAKALSVSAPAGSLGP